MRRDLAVWTRRDSVVAGRSARGTRTKMLKHAIAAVALAAFAAGAAQAADLPPVYPGPPQLQTFDWTGVYIGGNIGWGSASASYNVAGVTGSEHLTGVLGGIQAGYNWETGPWVLGLEVDGQVADQQANSSAAAGGVAVSVTDKVPWFLTARGRVGYAFAPMWMIYVTGGAVFADFRSTVVISTLGSGGWESSQAGWTAGAGLEGALDRNWSWRVEYLHFDAGTLNTTVLGAPIAVSLTDDIGRLGFNYRF